MPPCRACPKVRKGQREYRVRRDRRERVAAKVRLDHKALPALKEPQVQERKVPPEHKALKAFRETKA